MTHVITTELRAHREHPGGADSGGSQGGGLEAPVQVDVTGGNSLPGKGKVAAEAESTQR